MIVRVGTADYGLKGAGYVGSESAAWFKTLNAFTFETILAHVSL